MHAHPAGTRLPDLWMTYCNGSLSTDLALFPEGYTEIVVQRKLRQAQKPGGA